MFGVLLSLDLDAPGPDGTAAVRPDGPLDVASVSAFTVTVDALVDAGATRLIVDGSRLSFLDASGIAAIVAIETRLGAGAVVLVAPSPVVRRVLGACNLLGLISSAALGPSGSTDRIDRSLPPADHVSTARTIDGNQTVGR